MKIDKSLLSIPVEFENIEETEIADERFIRVKVYLMHTGLNLNKTEFKKSVVEKAIPTLGYIPIVGFIEQDKFTGDKDFEGHEYVIVKDENGFRRKYIGHGYGVIKSFADNNAHFEMKMCDDGIEREYLCVDGLIWTQFEDSANIFKEDVIKGHSMELYDKSVSGYEDENGIFHFTDFSFRAACILGDDKTPAMVGSTVEVQYSVNDIINHIQKEINNKYDVYTQFVKTNGEGGNEQMPNLNKDDYTMSINQQIEIMYKLVEDAESYRNSWGEDISRYCFVDIQDNEVIVMDRKDNYSYVGFVFTVNGDNIEIDFTSGNKKKIVYDNLEDGSEIEANEYSFTIVNEIKSIEKNFTAKIDELTISLNEANEAKELAENNYTQMKSDYDDIESKYNEMKPKYDDYVIAEQTRQEQELKEKKNMEFERFEKALGSNEEFISLKENIDDMTVEEINSKCSILFTRLSLENKLDFTLNNSGSAIGIIDEDNDDMDGYASIDRYGNIPVGR